MKLGGKYKTLPRGYLCHNDYGNHSMGLNMVGCRVYSLEIDT